MAKNGAITLTNAMFGIVDVDTPADKVRIWLELTDLDTRELLNVEGGGVVQRVDATGLPVAGQHLDPVADKFGRVLVKIGGNGVAADWLVLGQEISQADFALLTSAQQQFFTGGRVDAENTWQLTSFTLKHLIDGHVVFLHEVSDERAAVLLRRRSSMTVWQKCCTRVP